MTAAGGSFMMFPIARGDIKTGGCMGIKNEGDYSMQAIATAMTQ
jgi:hypothetical protein